MKILYISHTSEMQGSGKAILNIMLQMLEKGIDILILIPNAKGSLFDEVNKNNIKYKTSKIPAYIWPKLSSLRDYYLFPYRLFRFFINKFIFKKELIKVIKKYRPDIIHTNVGIIHTGHYIAKKKKIPQVWHIREYQDLDFGWKPYPSKCKYLRLLTHINNYPVAITNGVYQHHYLEKNKNAQVIYDGVFDKTSIPKIKTQKKKYFLFVGLVSEGKGTNEAIEGFISVADKIPNYELWIAGSGNTAYIDKLKKKCTQTKLGDKIKFLGYRTDVDSLMSEATALIVSSKFEGFGFITAEAMYNGCLVIGRDSAGTKEQFDNGFMIYGEEIGFRYNTPLELSLIIKQIAIKGANNYIEMIKKGQDTAVKLYNSQLNADKIFQLYKKILVANGE